MEIYRKFLWFLLRERPFDTDAVQDLVALKRAAGLSDTEVAEAIRERAQVRLAILKAWGWLCST